MANPGPIHLQHGAANIQWDFTTEWIEADISSMRWSRSVPATAGAEERTGLHQREFIETRRHWFTKKVEHDTRGGVHVLNLVEGEEAVVESPTHRFEPFLVHYAETFIVPAAVGPYTIRPLKLGKSGRCGTVQAFVRT